MDQRKFIDTIRNFPQIWDRSHPQFRDKDAKDCAWEVVGIKMGCSGDICKETFKSIREKYVREREKAKQFGSNYREWDLLPELKFLDPNIVPRKQSVNSEQDMQTAEEFQINYGTVYLQNLKKEVNPCMLRWKALREKYIRQRIKYQQESDAKWELLDEMCFLDKVIQCRKKADNDPDYRNAHHDSTFNNFHRALPQQNDTSQESENYTSNSYNYEPGDDNSLNDSLSDYTTLIKQENSESTVFQIADSSYSHQGSSRKRSSSINSETIDKRLKSGDTEPKQKTPEQLFGDLVAAMLTKKPENDRNLYMIEIMTVLSK
ncbi:hypothetical protein NQ317_003613 [Molorchus minor]|uniref:MADF domain-containing protein n=1 Tax=Molorchus minor TaxID=1323400 RepID=A0ABQ9JHM3_9CUCU|nr:hypothetical protein NQ317_003613 [Molorchus minor]